MQNKTVKKYDSLRQIGACVSDIIDSVCHDVVKHAAEIVVADVGTINRDNAKMFVHLLSFSETQREGMTDTRSLASVMLAEGYSSAQVCEYFSKDSRFLWRLGLDSEDKPKPPRPVRDRKEIAEMHIVAAQKEHRTISAVSAATGYSMQLVRRVFHKRGIPVTVGNPTKTKEELGVTDEQIIEAYEKYGTFRKAAQHLGITPYHVRKFIREYQT